jgi:DNA-binding transcriptional ArsR family regulator
MPALSESTGPAIRVAPSAPLELMWAIHFAAATHEHDAAFATLEAARLKFGERLRGLWDDGVTQYSAELLVLAERAGAMLDRDVKRFFNHIDVAIADTAALPPLRSESAGEIEVVSTRLERLRKDAQHRSRYLTLLSEVWASVEPEWITRGRASVDTEARRWAKELSEGMPYRRILEVTQLWGGRPQLDGIADTAAAEGRLIMNPCWFGGKIHILDLGGGFFVGRGFRSNEVGYRRVAADVSANLKTLAEPTRLAILLRLAREPASVTEIARQFDLSQPTVSAHVQLLREAGLLDEKTVGRSAKLSATQEGLRRLFSDAEESLLRLYRD